MLPGLYLVGAIAIFATRSNQRLGDLAAGTIVVREPRARGRSRAETFAPTAEVAAGELPAWDVSGLSQPELAALRRFLERRHALDDVPRNLLARDLADRLRAARRRRGRRSPAGAVPRADRRAAPHPRLGRRDLRYGRWTTPPANVSRPRRATRRASWSRRSSSAGSRRGAFEANADDPGEPY